MTTRISRRAAIKAAAVLAAPNVFRSFATAAPSETLLHASVGAGGMAGSDIGSLTRSKNLKLVAVADVDADKTTALLKKFPDVRVYADWRVMLDRERSLDSVSISCPDHMHAAPTLRAMRMGKHVYTQKPLTQTIREARTLATAAAEAKVVTQMGIQIHSASEHKMAVAAVRSGVIGKVSEVHSWSGKDWGDPAPRPDRRDMVPPTLDWDKWLGVAAERHYLAGGYYHPGNWRKRLDFGTGTFGDMGCHILDPVFGALGVKYAKSVHSTGDAPNEHNWPLHCQVRFDFPGTAYTAETVTVHWYNGNRRPPEAVAARIAPHKLPGQGSVYIGSGGVLFSPYIGKPIPLGAAAQKKIDPQTSDDHYRQWVDAARGVGAASAPFAYAGPLTEMVLLGCLATRFPGQKLDWDAETMTSPNVPAANKFAGREYRKRWEE